jgi:hypothetical protein
MNHPVDNDIPPFDDAVREREWQAQEHAMRRERLRLDAINDDARTRRYRLLARALREPLPDALPVDFAQRMAARIAIGPLRQPQAGTRFEFMLITALATLLVLATGIVTAIYGSAWLSAISAVLPAGATRWLLIFASCIGVSWLLGLGLGQRHPHGRPLL